MRTSAHFMPWGSGAVLAAVVAIFVGQAANAAQVDFESLPIGQSYGGSNGHVPGQVVFNQDGIDVSVETFQTGVFTDFNRVTINGPGTDLFATRHASFNNINFGFDLSAVPGVTSVSIEYREFGGINNFAVNGGTIFELPAMTDMIMNVAPGVTATVDTDSIHLSGPVSSFLIGGQELAIDNIVAIPEPTCLALLATGLGAGLLARRRRCS